MKKIITIVFVFYLLGFVGAEAKHYKGGELRTKVSYLYGRFETRLKASSGSGQLCSFFTYHEIELTSDWNEIDIEIMGRYTDDVQFNAITPRMVDHVSHQPVDFNPSVDFHTYGFEWTPEYVAWFVDGIEMHRQTGEHISTLDKDQKIMMNIWNPIFENWAGSWNEDILPVFAYYDWVSYASYTPGDGDTSTGNNFTHQWTDTFDSLDTVRWEKATHTFPGNQCDFIPENIVFQNGYMILCLTDNTNLGYVDNTPPAVLWTRASENKVAVVFSEEVEKESAEELSNYYVIPDVSVLDAVLLTDNRHVELSVSGMEMDTDYKLVAMRIKDTAPSPNVLDTQAEDIIMPTDVRFPLYVNVAGDTFEAFLPDQEWSEEVEYGHLDGTITEWPSDLSIAGTENDDVYRSERVGLVFYRVRVPNGLHTITLLLAENYYTEINKRIFDVYIEGILVVDDLDIFGEAGSNTAYEIVVPNVEITDAVIDIHFSASVDRPLLNGLIIAREDCPGEIGDVNGDGEINVLDAMAVINHILGTVLLDECSQARSDVNADGMINVVDVINIVNIILYP